jgi:hypothetical protein
VMLTEKREMALSESYLQKITAVPNYFRAIHETIAV